MSLIRFCILFNLLIVFSTLILTLAMEIVVIGLPYRIRSGILNELKPGQRILAHKGYNARNLFACKRCFPK